MLVVAVLYVSQTRADRLDDIKETGVLHVSMPDTNPPLGYADAKTGESARLSVGYA